jgi:hypothetical protein
MRRALGAGREQFWHPALFVLEDRISVPGVVPAHGALRLPHALRRRARARSETGLPPTAAPAQLQRFLQFLLPYLRWRLVRALSLDRDDELPSELLLRRADLSLTATHVDLRMSLEGVRLSVRLAGLDVDPGWVPAFSRVISFHFV